MVCCCAWALGRHGRTPIRDGRGDAGGAGGLPELPDEERLDLTGLPAYAIDDEGNLDPDDALSLDGDRLWVHIADVAALVRPGSPADLEARARGATLYLPETTVPMLPAAAVPRMGLGLSGRFAGAVVRFEAGCERGGDRSRNRAQLGASSAAEL
jgi:hypothetical protein